MSLPVRSIFPLFDLIVASFVKVVAASILRLPLVSSDRPGCCGGKRSSGDIDFDVTRSRRNYRVAVDVASSDVDVDRAIDGCDDIVDLQIPAGV